MKKPAKQSYRAKIIANSSSGIITLSMICFDIDMEPQAARRKLRSLRKSGKLRHDVSGSWEWPTEHVASIKSQLLGNASQKSASAEAKPAEAKPAKRHSATVR